MSQQFKHIHGYVALKVSDLYEELKGDPKEYAERLRYVMDRVSCQGRVVVVIDNYLGCRLCVLYEQYCRNPDSLTCQTGCYGGGKTFGGKSVYFKPVRE